MPWDIHELSEFNVESVTRDLLLDHNLAMIKAVDSQDN